MTPATKQDNMASAICHLQAAIEFLDDVGQMQDLFKQDYKRKVKHVISETEKKINFVFDSMTEEERGFFWDLLKEKQALYKQIEGITTIEQIALFRNFIHLQSKLL